MTLPPLPQSIDGLAATKWETFAPYFAALQQQAPTAESLPRWLHEWSQLSSLVMEAGAMIYIEKALDTKDETKEQIYLDYVDQIMPPAMTADQELKKSLLAVEKDAADDKKYANRAAENSE